MESKVTELCKCKYAAKNIPKGVFLLPVTVFVIVMLLPLIINLNQSSSEIYAANSLETTKRCNLFSGKWVPYLKGPYYSNDTCPFITDKQNCFMHGRPDREFLKWRWKPDECELPLFDAALFLKLVRGKSMAFVGDSVGRNQMESLLCLLNSVSHSSLTPLFASLILVSSIIWFQISTLIPPPISLIVFCSFLIIVHCLIDY